MEKKTFGEFIKGKKGTIKEVYAGIVVIKPADEQRRGNVIEVALMDSRSWKLGEIAS